MKTHKCPWCEGNKVVGRTVNADEPQFVEVTGVKIPSVRMQDMQCPICGGEGEVSQAHYDAMRAVMPPFLSLIKKRDFEATTASAGGAP